MSEAFDPEHVFRYTAHNFRLREDGDTQAGMVALEDYDKLLALYREAVKPDDRCDATIKRLSGDRARCQLAMAHTGSHEWSGPGGCASWARDSRTHPAIIP